jgi:hypothetical protein
MGAAEMRAAAGFARLTGAGVFATFTVLCLCGFAANDLKSVLQARYAEMKAAMAAHNDAAVAAILAPGFISIDTSGQSEGASQMISEVDRLQPDPNKTSTTTLESVTQHGDTAMVEQRYDMRTTKTGPDGVHHKVELITRSTDTWVKPKATWLLQKTVTNELSYYVDGAVVAHKARQ